MTTWLPWQHIQYYCTNFRFKILFQRFLRIVKKYHGVVITIKNVVTKILDDSSPIPPDYIDLKGNRNKCHFKTLALKEYGGSIQVKEDWAQSTFKSMD